MVMLQVLEGHDKYQWIGKRVWYRISLGTKRCDRGMVVGVWADKLEVIGRHSRRIYPCQITRIIPIDEE